VKSPKVGIFWLVQGKLLFDSTLVDDAEPYGDCKNHPQGHVDRWKQLQMAGMVPRDVEYEENPRGRIVYNVKTHKFMLHADRCILKKRNVVKKIMEEMQLPPKTTECGTDEHYRCYRCLGFEI
jgi:hypothetical protein